MRWHPFISTDSLNSYSVLVSEAAEHALLISRLSISGINQAQMANPLHIFLPFSISKQPKHLTADTQVTVVQLIQESSQQHANFWHNPTQAYGTCTERYDLSPHLAN